MGKHFTHHKAQDQPFLKYLTAATAPKKLLEMQILQLTPDLLELEL
jgi:hypothetical protein